MEKKLCQFAMKIYLWNTQRNQYTILINELRQISFKKIWNIMDVDLAVKEPEIYQLV